MKKLLFLLLVWLYPIFGFGAINECLTDVYYANGMQVNEGNATASTTLLRNVILEQYGGEAEMKKHIGKVKEAYNSTHGLFPDLFESFMQKVDLQLLIDWYALLKGYVTSHLENSRDQINAYKSSIMNGHKVLVVAHSQGNLFTGEAYITLGKESKNGWMQGYFEAVSVASPREADIKKGTKRVDWDNDPVSRIATRGKKSSLMTADPTRKVSWKSEPYIGEAVIMPSVNYVDVLQLNKMYKERYKAVEDGLDFSFNVHAFKYYMGEELGEGKILNPFDDKPMKTNDAKTKIMTAIKTKLEKLEKVKSQWKPKNLGCLCKDKYVKMTHAHDPENMKFPEPNRVKDFAKDGNKVYSVDEEYVRATCGGVKIEEVKDENSDLCYILKDENLTNIGEIRGNGITPVTAHSGALKMTLSWTYQCDIDMDLTMTGNDAVVYDIKDVEGAGKEHLVIPSLFDIKPGDHYVFNANGKQLPDSELTEEMLAEDPIEIRALLETTKGDYFNVWPVESFASLNLGDFAEVDVFETIQPEWVCPAVNDVQGWHRPYNADTGSFQCLYCPSPYSVEWRKPPYNYQKGSWYCKRPYRPRVYTGGSGGSGGGRTYNACSEEEKKSTCGCVPCDYIVSGLKKRIENGPIAGAKVEIIKASDADGINPTVLYRGSTTDKEDIFQSGLLEIPDATLDTFEDDEYYLVLAEGGRDIDRDDDMVRDSVPTQNNGTIHALIKGSDLKKLPFRVNILTEAIYQVSGNSIGLNYDALALQTKLNTTAQKLINHKLYPGDDDNRINYKDVLLWTPAVDKKALYKPFTTYVEPIIESLYANKERFDESYRLIYEPYESNAPQLEPLALEIPEGLDNGIVIAQIKTQNHKTFEHIVLQGNFSEHFSVDDEGYIHIAQTSLIEESNRYRLEMKAVDAAGREGSFVSLLIEVKGQIVKADPTTSSPRFISVETFDTLENAPEGTVVANTHFEDSNQTIVGYSLTGDNNSSFSVDNQGIVTVSVNADIDYEKSKVYRFAIFAMNDAGNKSYPITISIPIVNQLDTPLFDLVVFEHIEENTPKGSVITTIRADREGLGAIEKFEILSPNIPFTIDNNGTLIVSNYIDYEQVKQYDFYAIARTKYGNSNKIEIHIVVDNQSPEIGVPTLEDLTITVDENVTSGSKIGQLTLDAGATAIERIALYGEDDNFRVDNNGSIYLSDHATLDYETKTRYDLGARALNSRGYGNEVHIIIEVKNIADELPTITEFRESVEENATTGTQIGQIVISGSGETEISSFELIGTGSENFSIDMNGTIRVSEMAQLDYESKKSYLLQAVIGSAAGSSFEAEVVIYILNVAEHVPVLKPLILSVEENATLGTIVEQVEEDVGGDSPIVSYTLDDNSTFSIDANGTIHVHATLDYELQTTYTLAVSASNVVGESNPATVSINITNIIDDEPMLKSASFSIAENTTVGTVLGSVEVNSMGTSAIESMTLSGIGSQKFSIDVNGTVKLEQTVDYESKKVYHLYAVAANAKADSPTVNVVINVLNVAEHVPVLYAFKGFVEDNATAGTAIGEIQFASRGDSPVGGFLLEGTGRENFTIDANGTIRVSGSATLDESMKKVYTLQVSASNGTGSSDAVEVSIVLTHDKVKPYKPSNMKLLDIGYNSITLGWVDNAQNERGFNLYVDGVKYITLNPDTTSYRVTGLEEETSYIFTLKSFNDRGESQGLSIEGITDIDRSEYLKAVLGQKCGVSESAFDVNFNADTGHYSSSIYCASRGLTDIGLLNFKALKSIAGYLYLNNNSLTNLDGLSNLKSTGREFHINNNQLININGLSKLETVGREFRLENNQLSNVNGLNSLRSVGGHFYLNSNELTNVNGLSSLTNVGGYLYLQTNQLTNIDGLSALSKVGNNFNVEGNQLTNLDGLTNLTSLGGYLALRGNANLTDISGVGNAQSSNGKLLYINPNQYTTKVAEDSNFCSTVWDLRDPTGNIADDMSQVCESQAPYDPSDVDKLRDVLGEKCSIDSATFYSNFNADTGHYNYYIWCGNSGLNDDDLQNFKALKSVRYGLYLDRNNFTNTDGLSNLKSVGYELHLYNNKLTNVDGLSKLETVGREFRLENNRLSNVNGLSSLTNVGGYLYLQTNQLTNIDGLSALSKVGNNFNVEGNQLTNLDGLTNLTSLGGYLALRGNANLTDISGVGNIVGSDGQLLYITPGQYEVKANKNLKLCSATWDLRDINGDIDDNMTLVCGEGVALSEAQQLRAVMEQKCSVSFAQFANYFDEGTGIYSSSLDCAYQQMIDDDLMKFAIVNEIQGSFSINDNNLTNLDGLDNLSSVGGYFYLFNNTITDISGLSSLSSVNGVLDLSHNKMFNLDGLAGLVTVQGIIKMYYNTNLADIIGLSNIAGIDGKKIYIDSVEYAVKADNSAALCASKWDIYDTTGNVRDDMSRLCDGYSYVPNNTDKLRDLLGKRCSVDSSTFYSNFSEDSGIYNGDIKCQSVRDEEMRDFTGLFEVHGSFAIKVSSITTVDELIRLKNVTGTLSMWNNPNLKNIDGLSNILGVDNQKLIIDDKEQYDIKADTTKDFCATDWDMYDGETNIVNDMSKVCGQ